MRAEARASRFWLLFAFLLVLVAVSVPAAPRMGSPYPEQDFSVLGGSVSDASSGYHELHDRPPGSSSAGHTSTAAAPDTWWVVWQRATGASAPRAQQPTGDADRPVMSATTSASTPSRAPPRA